MKKRTEIIFWSLMTLVVVGWSVYNAYQESNLFDKAQALREATQRVTEKEKILNKMIGVK